MRTAGRIILILSIFLMAAFSMGCADNTSRATGVYMLIDTSGTYTDEMKKAQGIVSYLLGTLSPGDSLAVARIDSGSFSEKDIIARMTFDSRPSVSNQQKLKFRDMLLKNTSEVKGSSHTDISGGILQAVEYLNETRAGRKYILIFSDLKEDLPDGYVRDVPFELKGFEVVALNVTKLNSDNVNPREYIERVQQWQGKVVGGGGNWKVLNDLERVNLALNR